jgi:V8-like Glu-specific endopeptidase
MHKKLKNQITTVALICFGVILLNNQKLSMKDPENTYPKRIRRAVRLWINPPENELEKHLIGKGIACDNRNELYKTVASSTVLIKTDEGLGAGVFVRPNLIATAAHVVDGKELKVYLPAVEEEFLAKPDKQISVRNVTRVRGLDLAFIVTRDGSTSWLNLERDFNDDENLMVVGHPNGKYYSLQKARIKKKAKIRDSNYIYFKDNEIFFGNSGGAIVSCNGNLAGIVSMMDSYDNSMHKQGIGINSLTVERYIQRLKLS